MPKYSVVILSHRWRTQPTMVQEAIASVLGQTEQDVQVIVQFCEENWGSKLNEAVNATRGEYVTILCDDDTIAPTFLEKCGKVIRAGAAIVHTDTLVLEDGQEPRHYRPYGERFQHRDAYLMELNPLDDLYGNTMSMTFLCTRTLWDAMEGFDPTMPHAECDFWARVVAAGSVCGYIPEPLYHYRQHPTQYHKARDQYRDFIAAFHAKHGYEPGTVEIRWQTSPG